MREQSAVSLPSTVAPSECLYLASVSLDLDLISDAFRLLCLFLILKCDIEAIVELTASWFSIDNSVKVPPV